MSLLDFLFGKKEKSATTAKSRLQIIIAQERVLTQGPDYLPVLQKELLEVLAKYTNISPEDIKIDTETKDGVEVLELNITLPTLSTLPAEKEETPKEAEQPEN